MDNTDKKRYSLSQVVTLLTIAFLGLAAISYAVTMPHTFTPGTTISSSQVNANFTALTSAMPAAAIKYGTSTVTVTAVQGDTAAQQIMMADVVPSADGNIVVIANGYVYIGQSDATKVLNGAILFLSTDGSFDYAKSVLNGHTGLSNDFTDAAFSIVDVFPAEKGVKKSFYLLGMRDPSGKNRVDIVNPRMAILFVPNSLAIQ